MPTQASITREAKAKLKPYIGLIGEGVSKAFEDKELWQHEFPASEKVYVLIVLSECSCSFTYVPIPEFRRFRVSVDFRLFS